MFDDIVFPDAAPIVARFIIERKKVRVFERTHWTACGIPMHMHRIETRITFKPAPTTIWDDGDYEF